MHLKEGKEEKNPPRDNLLIVCYIIAFLELIHSLTFAFNCIYELSVQQNTYNVIAYLSGFAYVVTVKGLVVGLWKRAPFLILCWLIFCALVTVISFILLLRNITTASVLDKEHFFKWTLEYVVIIYQCTCVFLVLRYYKKLNPYSPLEGATYFCADSDVEKAEEETEDEEDDEKCEDDSSVSSQKT